MGYQKFVADGLFDGCRMHDNQSVLIITDDGIIETIAGVDDAGDGLRRMDGILCPGLINCHCHLELSYLLGRIPEHGGLVSFISQVMTSRGENEAVILDAIERAEQQMVDTGIVAVGDICNASHSIPQKTKCRINYHNFIEVAGFLPALAQQRFDRAMTLYREFAAIHNGPRHHTSIVPHAPYSVSPQLLSLVNGFSGNGLMTFHNQETAAEDQFYQDKKGEFVSFFENLHTDLSFFQPTGRSSLQSFLPLISSQHPLILVHNLLTTTGDISYAREAFGDQSVFWCLCPNANSYISNQLPDPDLFRHENCTLVLGTDSLASNHQLSIAAEMHTLMTNFPHLPLEEILSWATINGARALQMDKLLGSFEPAKKPGLVLLSSDLTSATRLV